MYLFNPSYAISPYACPTETSQTMLGSTVIPPKSLILYHPAGGSSELGLVPEARARGMGTNPNPNLQLSQSMSLDKIFRPNSSDTSSFSCIHFSGKSLIFRGAAQCVNEENGELKPLPSSPLFPYL